MPHAFQELGIDADLVKGVAELGIEIPTRVQQESIPFLVKEGHDLIAQAQTGTGKTAAFGLPLLMKINPKSPKVQGLVVAPTRELAKQVGKQLFRFTKYSAKIFVEVTSGGDKIDRQIAALSRPTQIIVATPGRLLDLVRKGVVDLSSVERLVLDEADEMLSLGFKEELREILRLCKQRQSTWLFSATFPTALDDLIRGAMPADARRLVIDEDHVVNRDIDHRYAVVDRQDKDDFIAAFLRGQGEGRGVIFCRTRLGSARLGTILEERGYSVDVLQGELSQQERDKVMRGFKKGRSQFLIATDVMARGIDVPDLAFVLHHQLPEHTEYYTHRSGRTARAGKKGISLALVEPNERRKIERLEKELGVYFDEVPANLG